MLLESVITDPFTVGQFLLCTAASLALGFVTALLYKYKNSSSKSFVITLVILPAVVQTVILLVNGDIGIGIAVAGAFSLIRFRSVPGTAKEIIALFMTMAIGLATGTGYLLLAALFTLVVGGAFLLLGILGFGAERAAAQTLRITVPESLDYTGMFDDILGKYTTKNELMLVSTSNMGSLYELTYNVVLPKDASTREFIDQIRTRNGNLKVTLGHCARSREEL